MTAAVLLLDLSSYMLYRYYALKRWLVLANKQVGEDALYQQYDKLFETQLKKFVKQFKLSSWTDLIVARDCPRNEIWRRDMYDAYKGTRPNEQMIPASFFTHVYQELLPRLTKKYGFNILSCDRAEADDVIAVCHNTMRGSEASLQRPIIILSMDSDFLQLYSDFTKCYDFKLKDMSMHLSVEKLVKYLHWKIIRGDDSDNISAIDAKIGDATAWKLAFDETSLQRKFDANAQVRDRFLRNDMLINFANIPKDIVENIQKNIKARQLV